MIKVNNHLPEYYYSESRDFQLFGRIFEAVFNYFKSSIDTMTNVPLSNNLDESLVDLVTKTVGFETKNNYDINNLLTVTNAFKNILKVKGTERAINDAVKVLLKAQNISEKPSIDIENITYIEEDSSEGKVYTKVNNYTISIYVSYIIRDKALLEDILEYILPFGYNYEIISVKNAGDAKRLTMITEDSLEISEDKKRGDDLGIVVGTPVVLSTDELDNINVGTTDNTVVVRENAGQ